VAIPSCGERDDNTEDPNRPLGYRAGKARRADPCGARATCHNPLCYFSDNGCDKEDKYRDDNLRQEREDYLLEEERDRRPSPALEGT